MTININFYVYKGMSASAKNCNFSCTCNRDDCERKHYIEDINDRKIIKISVSYFANNFFGIL